MFSVENFYYVLYENLLKPATLAPVYFHPFGSTDNNNLMIGFKFDSVFFKNPITLFYDQEPLLLDRFNCLTNRALTINKYCKILANSEHSQVRKQICRDDGYVNWYYFYHGFAALDWYRDYQYLPKVENHFTKVFICLNRLVTKDRSYRLLLASEILSRNLQNRGYLSLSLIDHGYGTWQDELASPITKLPSDQLDFINQQLSQLPGSLIVDKEQPVGSLSADAGTAEMELNQSALWHVVSETVFYYDKLHLTEKVFKPIVSRRPFLLVAAPGNLAYLKSYGFKTFDRWVDESYDSESDPARRIKMIANALEKLCKLSNTELKQMHEEMKDILEYNFNHFYSNFKKIIVREMLENFKGAVNVWNNGRVDGKTVNLDAIDFNQVEQIFLK